MVATTNAVGSQSQKDEPWVVIRVTEIKTLRSPGDNDITLTNTQAVMSVMVTGQDTGKHRLVCNAGTRHLRTSVEQGRAGCQAFDWSMQNKQFYRSTFDVALDTQLRQRIPFLVSQYPQATDAYTHATHLDKDGFQFRR